MTLEQLEKKTIKTSRGYTYTFYNKPARDNQPTLLMIHGFPDSADSWEEVINNYLAPNGYGIIAVVCLGYWGSSRPTEMEAYNWRRMTQDLREIVEKEGLKNVVVLGHDWVNCLAHMNSDEQRQLCPDCILLTISGFFFRTSIL